MAKQKPKLADAIRRKLQESNLTQKEFAIEQRIDHDSFRAQLHRNVYSPYILKVAATLLTGGDHSELGKKYVFGETKKKGGSILPATQSLRERLTHSIKPPSSELTHDIQRLYSWLGGSDLAVICSLDLPPLECTPQGWFQLEGSITSAVRAGTAFVYIRPSPEVIRQQAKVLPECFSQKTPRDEFDELQKRLLTAVGSNKGDANKVRENVKLHEVTWSPFWSIGMRFGFYSIWPDDGDRPDRTLFARFPFGGNLTGDDSIDSKLLLFADQRTKNAFHSYLIQSFASDSDLRPLLDRLR